MKKVLSILLAILVIGACATTDANAKKKSTKSRKTTTTVASTVEKGAFVGEWEQTPSERVVYLLNIWYDSDKDLFTVWLGQQIDCCTGEGKLKGNSITFKCTNGYKITCTMKGDYLIAKIKTPQRTSHTVKFKK